MICEVQRAKLCVMGLNPLNLLNPPNLTTFEIRMRKVGFGLADSRLKVC